jgi:hypothetical protein
MCLWCHRVFIRVVIYSVWSVRIARKTGSLSSPRIPSPWLRTPSRRCQGWTIARRRERWIIRSPRQSNRRAVGRQPRDAPAPGPAGGLSSRIQRTATILPSARAVRQAGALGPGPAWHEDPRQWRIHSHSAVQWHALRAVDLASRRTVVIKIQEEIDLQRLAGTATAAGQEQYSSTFNWLLCVNQVLKLLDGVIASN